MMNARAARTSSDHELLLDEYAKSIDLIKYYDERHIDLLKFASGLAAGVPTIVFAFYGLSDTAASHIWDFAAFIGAITGIALLSIFASMVQNRVYFVFPARQANVIRAAFFTRGMGTEINNQMYTTEEVPMFDWNSTQTLQLLFVALQTAFFFGVATYAWRQSNIKLESLTSELWVVGVIFAALAGVTAVYLTEQSKRLPDEVIRNRRTNAAIGGGGKNKDRERQ